MNKILRVGEMVWTGIRYEKGKQIGGYGPIHKIVDRVTGELYQEKKIITGQGDKNTKVDIIINIMYSGSNPHDVDDDMIEVDPIELKKDPHNVVKIEYKSTKVDYRKMLSRMNKKMDILYQYSLTREDKINIIIN